MFEQYYYLPSVEPWAMMYSPGREYFFVSTSISQVYLQSLVVNFNCSTGINDVTQVITTALTHITLRLVALSILSHHMLTGLTFLPMITSYTHSV